MTYDNQARFSVIAQLLGIQTWKDAYNGANDFSMTAYLIKVIGTGYSLVLLENEETDSFDLALYNCIEDDGIHIIKAIYSVEQAISYCLLLQA